MRQKVKQLMGILLCLVMVLSLMPGMSLTAYADDTDETEKTQVSVQMVWEDNDDAAHKRPESIRVQLYADGLALGSPVTLDESNSWSCSWSDLTKYVNESGQAGSRKAIAYTVDETAIPEGYVGKVTGSAETGFVITNTYETGKLIIEKEFDIAPWEPFIPDDSPMDIPVIMTWNDNNNKDGNRPGSAVVRLLANGEEAAVVELNADYHWRYTFTGMPRLDENKEKINYTITVDPVEWYNAQINGFNIRNNYEPELTDAAVKMIWDDNNNEMQARPESIVMTLSNDMTVLLNDQNNWRATIKDLPTKLNGKPVSYTWTEQKVLGYDKVAEVTEGTVTTFMNRRWVRPAAPTADDTPRNVGDTVYAFGEYETPPGVELSESAAPTISKTAGVNWAGDDEYQSLRPDSVQLILMGDGEPVGEPKTVNAPSWETTWDDLPAQNTDGNSIAYTVKQMESLSAYTTTCDGLTVTNTLKTGSLNVKVSLDAPVGSDLSGLELAIDGPLLKKTLTYADVESGTVNLGRVPEGAYLIRETNADTLIEGYVMDPENSKVADAVYILSGESSVLEFKYTWKLREPIDEEVEEDYDPCADIGDLFFDILGPDAWNKKVTYAEFTDSKYELQGLEPGVYTVIERNAETLVRYYTLTDNSITGLAVEVKPGETTTAKLFNRYEPLPTPEPDAEFIDIPVTVTWNDNYNADGNRPESVTVRLYADGVEVDSHVLTAAEDWQYTFMDKPRYQEDNKTEIVYTVNEDEVPMYAATFNGFNIVNDYKPEVTSASVSVVWNDNNNEKNLRPDSIAMNLSDGQKVVKVVVLNEANGWTATVNNLPTVVNGLRAEYAWKEQQVLSYSLIGVTQQGNLMIFTNEVWKRPDSPENNPTINPKNRTYDGTEKPLVTVSGEPTGGTIEFALGSDAATAPEASAYTTSIPTATNAGTYYVWYKAEGDESHNDSSAVCVAVTISAKSSGGGGGGGSVTYAVNVDKTENGTVTASSTYAARGKTVTLTVKPDEGYQLDRLTVTEKGGAAVPVTDKGSGAFSFTMPAAAVTATVSFTAAAPAPEPGPEPVKPDCAKDATCPVGRFTDTSPSAWYHDGVHWALEQGVMNGVSDTKFAPDDPTTRAMVVTMLWRLEGKPDGKPSPFTDVPAGSWYEKAVNWAAENGIVKGTSPTTFSPDVPITREQLAAILYRYAQTKGEGFTGAWAFPLNFPDAADVSEYAYEAMCWMTMNGIITGMDDGTLAPKEKATRAQIAVMFQRICGEMEP